MTETAQQKPVQPATSQATTPAAPKPVATKTVNRPLGSKDTGRLVVDENTPAKDSPLADARYEVAQSVFERQQVRAKAPMPVDYVVECDVGGQQFTAQVSATNPDEAWAVACDRWKVWPSPRQVRRTIRCVG